MIQTKEQVQAKLASEALANLTTFHTVIKILEGGTLYGSRPHEAAAKIIRLCKTAAGVELRAMDRAMRDLSFTPVQVDPASGDG